MIRTTLGTIDTCPTDSILGLSSLIEADKRPDKIDATVGIIKEDSGKIFVPNIVKKFWKEIKSEPSNYLSPSAPYEWLGDSNFIKGTIDLIFDTNIKEHPERISAIGTVGGTGGIYNFLMIYAQIHKNANILISNPSWPNHQAIAQYFGYQVSTYQHLDKNNKYNFDEHIEKIKKLPKNSIVVLHAGLGHNPTGVNSSLEQLNELAKHMEGKVVLFDSAYLGLGESFETDYAGFNYFLKLGIPTAICVSFAKNAGLYNQRPGALLIPQTNSKSALEMQRMLNAFARLVYSTPPAQGEKIMGNILTDIKYLNLWKQEVTTMNQIILKRRQIFVKEAAKFKFVKLQKGLFSMLPLTLKQVLDLRKNSGIYLTDSARVNIGGVPTSQIQKLAKTINNL